MDPILFLSSLMAKLGYAGVAIATFVESIFPPIPSEIILPFAGFAAAEGKLNFIGVLVAATVGSLLGAVVFYAIGRLVSERHLQILVDRWGKYLGVHQGDIAKAQQWFDRHGRKAVFLGRMIPAVRSVISIPAGINRMPFGLFMMWSGIGTALWSILLCTAGYLLGNRYEDVAHILAPVSKVVVIVAIVAVVVFVAYRLFIKTKNK